MHTIDTFALIDALRRVDLNQFSLMIIRSTFVQILLLFLSKFVQILGC